MVVDNYLLPGFGGLLLMFFLKLVPKIGQIEEDVFDP